MPAEENPLEHALRLAAGEPAHRPAFYRALLDATVYVLGHTPQAPEGERMAQAGEQLAIQHWAGRDGAAVIPFFSSLAALQRAIEPEEHYVALPARALFEMTKGATLFLNPRSDYGKEFFPQEIEALLTTGLNQQASPRVTTAPTQVLLGQPAAYPTTMVESLRRLLSTHESVRAAYLALMHDPAHDEKPHLVVGIEAEGDVERVIREAGVVAGDAAPHGEPVDLVRVTRGEEGLSAYFLNEVEPFYQRG
jgi:hypothetical protein